MRKVLITGGTGQIGIELARQAWPTDVDLHLPDRRELDLGNAESVREAIARESWDCVINSAAYTAVDAAEDNAGTAFEANCLGPAFLAEATGKAGIPLIQISTDYVFSGDANDRYSEDDAICPIGVYGASKAAGELAVASGNPRAVILRTAWVLSPHRSNFLKTMLRLAAERPILRIVADQHGCPSSAADIARAVMTIALRHMEDAAAPAGIYHFVNGGEASWFDLAGEIFTSSAKMGGPSADLVPIETSDYPTRARRPANSRLSTSKITRDFGIEPRGWRIAVAEIVAEVGRNEHWKKVVR